MLTGEDRAAMVIPMSMPDIGPAEKLAVNEVLETGRLSIGPAALQFEKAFQEYVGARHAVAVSSGTAALHLAVIAAGVQANDLVITTPFSFIASANCVVYERAVPVFVDVDARTGAIDVAQVEEAVTAIERGGLEAERWLPPSLRGGSVSVGSVKAILPIHPFGRPVEIEPFLAIAGHRGLKVIEDACEALGAEYASGRRIGGVADAAAFAFYPNKQITTGEGGMLVTNDENWDALFRSLRNQGRDVFDLWLNHDRLGFNYRLDELSAALGVAQMSRIGELLANRERVARWYDVRLAAIEGAEAPAAEPTSGRMSWFVYVIRLDGRISRSNVIAKLGDAGIPSRPYFAPIHLQSYYARRFGYGPGCFPSTELLGRRSLALPFSGVMTEEQVEYVTSHLERILNAELAEHA